MMVMIRNQLEILNCRIIFQCIELNYVNYLNAISIQHRASYYVRNLLQYCVHVN